MWNNRGEKVWSKRYDQFISLHFRPWPMLTLTDEILKDVKKNMTQHVEHYTRLNELESFRKNATAIRNKLEAIRKFNARKLELQKIVEEFQKKRAENAEVIEV